MHTNFTSMVCKFEVWRSSYKEKCPRPFFVQSCNGNPEKRVYQVSSLWVVWFESLEVVIEKSARGHFLLMVVVEMHKVYNMFNLADTEHPWLARTTYSLTVFESHTSQKTYSIARSTSHRFLLARIRQNANCVKSLRLDLNTQFHHLSHHLDASLLSDVETHAVDVSAKESVRCKTRLKEKIRKMKSRSQPSQPQANQWVVNLSSSELSQSQRSVLSKGLNYALVPDAPPIPRIIAAVESGIRQLPDPAAHDIRFKIVGLLKKSKPPPSNITFEENKAIRELQQNPDIVVLPADKGNSTVVMDATEYDGKMRSLLSDPSTYKMLPKDPTESLQRKMNSKLLDLKKSNTLPTKVYNEVRCSSGSVPFIYGLPKVHKDGVPLRPIVSFYIYLTNLSTFQTPYSSPISTVGSVWVHCSQFKGVCEFCPRH